jgi:hypothetical protein
VWFFFYGTLMDPDVLHGVLQRRPSRTAAVPAVLNGYRRVYRADAVYPVLVSAPAARVHGRCVGPLHAGDAARLIAFEGEDYIPTVLSVRLDQGRLVAATVFLPAPDTPLSDTTWTPELWRRRHRRQFLQALRHRQRAHRLMQRVAPAASHVTDSAYDAG